MKTCHCGCGEEITRKGEKMKGKLVHLKDGDRTCTKHYKKVNKDGLCPLCLPNIDLYVDQRYANSRKALMPEAMRRAQVRLRLKKNKTELRPGAGGKDYNHCFLSEYFCDAMTKLVEESRIREK